MHDKSRKLFGINDSTKEVFQQLHDMFFIGTTTLIANPIIYLLAGERIVSIILLSSLLASLAGMIIGGLIGYMTDLFRDLTRYSTSKRLPLIIRQALPNVKKMLLVLVIVLSLTLTGAIYCLAQHF